MKIDAVGLHPGLVEIFRSQGIEELYPPQAEALGPVLKGSSVVLACPTSAGKSLVAYVALVAAALEGRRGIYIVPLRALASEKYRDLKAFEKLGVKVSLTMGERDITSQQLEATDILVATSEKTDSLLRHATPWTDGLGVVVADEVHLMGDPDRGPTLEVSLTRLRRKLRGLQVVALSATVGNSESLSRWLGAAHIRSEFRPVPLRAGVYRDGEIRFLDGSGRPVEDHGDNVESLVADMLVEGGQVVVFVNSRRSTVTLATRLGKLVSRYLRDAERKDLGALAQELGADSEEETEGLRQLGSLVGQGVAFHNAGLTNAERGHVEDAFRARRLKVLVATTTLAAGLNLPARRVIVRDTRRYDADLGLSVRIPAREVQQMLGRAGRPRLDPYGEAILLAKDPDEEEELSDRYLTAPPEDIESQLGNESVLRTHLLALVASKEVASDVELQRFLEATFHGQHHSYDELRRDLSRAQSFLQEEGLLEPGTRLRATAFGQLASDLYLDPVSAVLMRRALRKSHAKTPALALLAAIASTPDLAPLTVRVEEDEETVLVPFRAVERELLLREGEELVPTGEGFWGALKTAALLESWTDDRLRILEITQKFKVGAGDLRSRVERAEWLLSSMAFLALREKREMARPLDELAARVRYGIRADLLDLVLGLRGVGRVRGRLLFDAGWRDLEGLARAEETDIARVLGSPTLAKSVLEQARRRSGLSPPPGGGATLRRASRSPGPTTQETLF